MVQIGYRYLQVWSLLKVATLRFYFNWHSQFWGEIPFSKCSCLNTHNESWERNIDLLQNLVDQIWTYKQIVRFKFFSFRSFPCMGWLDYKEKVIVFCHNVGSQCHTVHDSYHNVKTANDCSEFEQNWESIENLHATFVLKTSILDQQYHSDIWLDIYDRGCTHNRED